MNPQLLLKIGLLGVAGYLAYRQLAGNSEPASTPEPPANGGASNSGAPPTSGPTLQTLVEQASILAGHAPGSQLSFDQWNYYFSAVRKVAGPAIEEALPGVPREQTMSVGQWYAAVSKLGVS